MEGRFAENVTEKLTHGVEGYLILEGRVISTAEAKRDGNFVTTIIAASEVDGLTPINVWADPVTHELLVKSTGGGGGGDVNLTEVGGTAIALGQTTMSASLPVAIASDQSTLPVGGNVASGAADSGNPVKTGSVYNSTQPTVTTGQRVDDQSDARGNKMVYLATKLDSVNDSVTADTELPAAATVAADGVTPTVPGVAAYGFIKTPGANTWDRQYSAVNATNSTGTGIAAVGNLAQFDDTSPTAITENQFGNLRMSANRNLYGTIRDAAGNERGANVDTNNNLGVVLAAETTKVIGTINIAAAQTLATVTTVSTVTALTGGGVADDATTPGNPVMVGGMAKSPDGTDPGSVSAENDVARNITDLNRRVYVNTNHPRSVYKHLDGTAAYTDESVFADPGDGFQTVITSIMFSSGEAVAINMFLEEGSTKIFGPVYLEAVAGRGFIWTGYLPVTASTAVTVTTSAANDQSLQFSGYIQAV